MKILVGYDRSDVDRRAIKLAIEHAHAFDAEVFLVHSMKGGREVTQKAYERIEHELGQMNNIFIEENIPGEPRLLVRGLSPGEDIVQFAQKNGVDEIIIGVKRRSKAGKLLFGSTAQYVILNAHCPVVTVK